MITFLYGPDSYRRDKRKQALIKESCMNDICEFRAFDGADEPALRAFTDFLGSSSLFRKKRLAMLVGVFEIREREVWNSVLTSALQSADVEIIIAADQKPEDNFSFLLEKPVRCESFEILDGDAWKSFVQKEAADRTVPLSREALRALTTLYHKNTWGLVTELEKLRGLGESTIRLENLPLRRGIPEDFWGTMNQLRSATRSVRLRTLEEVLAQEDPAKIFYAVTAGLKGREDAVARADLAIKSGKIDYEEALLGLLL